MGCSDGSELRKLVGCDDDGHPLGIIVASYDGHPPGISVGSLDGVGFQLGCVLGIVDEQLGEVKGRYEDGKPVGNSAGILCGNSLV